MKSIRHLKLSVFFGVVLVALPLWASINPYLIKRGIYIDVPVNMLLMYIGALSFYLGSVVFDMRCPRLIAEFQNRFDFVNQCVLQLSNIKTYQKPSKDKVEELTKKINDLIPAANSGQKQESEIKEIAKDFLMHQASAMEVSYLEEAWHKANKSRQFPAYVALSLFLISGGIGLYITLYDAPIRVCEAFC